MAFFSSLHGIIPWRVSTILETNDGGMNWIERCIIGTDPNARSIYNSPSPFSAFCSAYARDSLVGYIARDGKTFKTMDGGGTWTYYSVIDSDMIKMTYSSAGPECCFINQAFGYCSFSKSPDHGISWNAEFGSFRDLFMTPSGRVLLSGSQGINYSDDGNNFTSAKLNMGGYTISDITAIYMASSKEGFANSSLGLLYTFDGGQSWYAGLSRIACNAMYFVDDQIGFLAGDTQAYRLGKVK